MMTTRQFMQAEQLSAVVHAAFGSARRLLEVQRLTGGSKKGVYRLGLDDGSSTILYVWNDDENYWPASSISASDPFADASGLDLLEAAHAALDAAGVRVPKLLLVDRGRTIVAADMALAEDLQGGSLEALIRHDPQAAAPLHELGVMLQAMQRHRNPILGKVALVTAGTAPQDRRAEQIVLDRALLHLAAAAGRVQALAEIHDRIADRLRELADRILPRTSYSLIHGELGADHVMLDAAGRPVIIDIEGVMYFDAEWEHAFTEMRLGPAYADLGAFELDPARLAFYVLAQSLSLIEGPLRIADTDFPGRAFMLELAAGHTKKVLQLVAA